MTVASTDMLHCLVAMTPARVLRLLSDAAGEGAGAAVSLHLTGGQTLTGRLVSETTDQGHEVAVLHDPQTGRLAYALIANVIAVEVADPGPFTDVITGGRLPVPGEEGEVSRLALRREFGPGGPFPVQVDWDSLPGRGLVLANLARLLRGLRTVVEGVRSDAMGEEAWQRVRVLSAEHREGESLAVEAQADGLVVYADLAAALPRDLAGALSHRINAVL
jgi:hypothetical protein